MTRVRRVLGGTAAGVVLAAVFVFAQSKDGAKDTDPRPRIMLQARPQIAMSPARVVLTAELIGGANDFEEFYCPTVEWDWGDDTRSEVTNDCDPYESGKSEIRRRFSVQRIFRRAGTYQITFRLKRKDRQVAAASATVEVRPGARDIP